MNFILCGTKDEMVSDFMLASFSLTKECDNENNFYQTVHTNQIYCDQLLCNIFIIISWF